MYLVLALLSSNNCIIIIYCLNLLTSRCPNRDLSSRSDSVHLGELHSVCLLHALSKIRTYLMHNLKKKKKKTLFFYCYSAAKFTLTLSDNLQQGECLFLTGKMLFGQRGNREGLTTLSCPYYCPYYVPNAFVQ